MHSFGMKRFDPSHVLGMALAAAIVLVGVLAAVALTSSIGSDDTSSVAPAVVQAPAQVAPKSYYVAEAGEGLIGGRDWVADSRQKSFPVDRGPSALRREGAGFSVTTPKAHASVGQGEGLLGGVGDRSILLPGGATALEQMRFLEANLYLPSDAGQIAPGTTFPQLDWYQFLDENVYLPSDAGQIAPQNIAPPIDWFQFMKDNLYLPGSDGRVAPENTAPQFDSYLFMEQNLYLPADGTDATQEPAPAIKRRPGVGPE